MDFASALVAGRPEDMLLGAESVAGSSPGTVCFSESFHFATLFLPLLHAVPKIKLQGHALSDAVGQIASLSLDFSGSVEQDRAFVFRFFGRSRTNRALRAFGEPLRKFL